MRFSCFAAMLFVLAGCAKSEPAFLSNGQKVVRITCAAALDGMTGCFKMAGTICGPSGFVVYDWNGTPWDTPYPDPEVLEGDPGLASSGLLVACRT